MPPKTKIKKEDIIRTAFEIVRKEGMKALNARRIARELHCSVQPIFSNFSNMDDLKKVVIQLAFDKYIEYITSHEENITQYKAVGMNYIRLARDEPKLFQILFSTKTDKTFNHFMVDNESYDYIEKTVMKSVGIDKEDVFSFQSKMWAFTHGIASLIVTGTCTFTDEEVDELLTEQFVALSLLEKFKKENHIKSLKEKKAL